jgi:hypothetical protein
MQGKLSSIKLYIHFEKQNWNDEQRSLNFEIAIEVEPALGIAAKSPQHVKRSATARTCSQ